MFTVPLPSGGDTLLTSPLSDEERRRIEEDRQKLDQSYCAALDIWLQGYLAGDEGFETMCKGARNSLLRIGVSVISRQRIIGEMIDKALGVPEPKMTRGRKGSPIALRKTAAVIVDLVVEREKLPKVRSSTYGKISAYQRTVSILESAGFDVSEETVIKWYGEFRDIA